MRPGPRTFSPCECVEAYAGDPVSNIDKLQRIVRLLLEARVKSIELSGFSLDTESGARVDELMKEIRKSSEVVDQIVRTAETNGKLDKATLDATLDGLIKTFEDANKTLDDLLAKMKG